LRLILDAASLLRILRRRLVKLDETIEALACSREALATNPSLCDFRASNDFQKTSLHFPAFIGFELTMR